MRYVAAVTKVFGLFLFLALVADSAIAQSVSGTIRCGNSGDPIADASVILLDNEGAIQRGTLSDPDGTFQLVAPEEGTFAVRIGAAGYLTRDTPPIQLVGGEDREITVLLDTEQREGPPSGFLMRMAAGEGYFITREQIEERSSARFTDLLKFTPAVAVIPLPTSSRMSAAYSEPGMSTRFNRGGENALGGALQHFTVRIKAGRDFQNRATGAIQELESADDCPPVLWVDGLWWGSIDGASVSGPDGALTPGDLEAIEIYNHISILPDQFNSGRDSMCGVVVVWRKKSEEN